MKINNRKLLWKTKKKNERDLIKKVKRDPFYIQYIENPSEEVQLIAVKENPLAINYISKPYESALTYATKINNFLLL